MVRTVMIAALAACLLTACGESAEEKAQDSVCAARADIKKQTDELKGMTVSTATLDGVKANLKAIRDDLDTMAGAQGDLKGDRKADVQEATKAFKSQAADVTRQLGTSLSVADAREQIKSALQGLATSYEQSLAPIDCD